MAVMVSGLGFCTLSPLITAMRPQLHRRGVLANYYIIITKPKKHFFPLKISVFGFVVVLMVYSGPTLGIIVKVFTTAHRELKCY